MGTRSQELASLEKTLGLKGVPVLRINNRPCLEGLTTIASYLVKVAKKEELLGTTPEKSAVVHQWLEYRVTEVDKCTTQDDKKIILKDLNCYLEDKVYLAGSSFTLADIMLYNGLHPFMVEGMQVTSKAFAVFGHIKDNLQCFNVIPTVKLGIKAVAALTHEDREKYVNVSRWFDHIQHYPGVRQHSAAIVFLKNRLYPTVH